MALFLCQLFTPLYALCPAEGELHQAKVARVIDGDTLILVSNEFQEERRIRLVGVNTPELDHKAGNHEAYAWDAFQFLQNNYQGKIVFYQEGKDKRDRYGRYLYYLFDRDRISIGSRLLSRGLGYRVAIPPNVKYQSCLQQVEFEAKTSGKGVWEIPPHWLSKAGFAIADVIIKSATQNGGGWWLDTNLDLTINLPKSYQDQWTAQDIYSLEGQRVQVRGWQFMRKSQDANKKQWVMLVKHPNDLVHES